MEQLDSIYYVFFLIGLLLTFAILASKLSSIFGTPLLLLFLAIGMLTGEDGLFIRIKYDDYRGAFFCANFMLALIILDGGLRTSFSLFRRAASEAALLSTAGVLITSGITGAIAYCFIDISLEEALLLGAIVGSTDAGAVFSLLGDSEVSLKSNVSAAIQIESATNDPMAILLTTVMLTVITGGAADYAGALMFLIRQFGAGLVLGAVFGFIGRCVISSLSLGSGLYALLVFGIGLIGFSVTAALGGSGFLAIFIIGMIIGNQNTRQMSFVLPVAEGITWLCQIALFLMLGLLVTPHTMFDYLVPGAVAAAAITLVARPAAVFLCLKPFFRKTYSSRDLLFMSWVGLRGSVPIVLALYPVFARIDSPQLYFNVAFVVVIVSLLVQGTTLVPVSRLLKVYAPSSAMPVTKSNVGIRLANDYELYNYRVRAGSLEGLKLRDISFPKGTMIAGLFRDDHMLKAGGGTVLRHGDILSVIGTAGDEPLLNSVFSRPAAAKRRLPYRGDTLCPGTAPMRELAAAYGIELTDYELTLSVAEFMSHHIGGYPQIGDSVSLINVIMVVAALDGDLVAEAGLYLPDGSAGSRGERRQTDGARRARGPGSLVRGKLIPGGFARALSGRDAGK